MKANLTCGSPVYCDLGPYAGDTRIDFRGSVYLTPEEAERYFKEGLSVVLGTPEDRGATGDQQPPGA